LLLAVPAPLNILFCFADGSSRLHASSDGEAVSDKLLVLDDF
jgi:hypothetical protein